MKKHITTYQFWCNLEYLYTHKKEFSKSTIFITEIIGRNCEDLRVTFIMISYY